MIEAKDRGLPQRPSLKSGEMSFFEAYTPSLYKIPLALMLIDRDVVELTLLLKIGLVSDDSLKKRFGF